MQEKSPLMRQFVDVAERAVTAAGEVIRSYYHQQLVMEHKAAASPIVTEADLRAEQILRAELHKAFPDHAIFGEEEGYQAGQSGYEWILDPIDGTIAFSCGKPVFASLVSLCKDGEPVLGIIDQPIVGHRWVGVKGERTVFNGSECEASKVVELQTARLSTTAPEMFDGDMADFFLRLKKSTWVTSYGGDAYAYGLLASGHVDVIVERGLGRHDIAALLPVVRGAGGSFTDFAGMEIERLESHTSERTYEACVSANAELASRVLSLR